jgi:hypothetical protein
MSDSDYFITFLHVPRIGFPSAAVTALHSIYRCPDHNTSLDSAGALGYGFRSRA